MLFVKSFVNNTEIKYLKIWFKMFILFLDTDDILFILINLYEPDFN